MSIHLVLTREVNLEQLHHVFAYLNKDHNYELAIDPSYQVIDQADFGHQDWTSINFGHVSSK